MSSTSKPNLPTYDDVLDAARLLEGVAHRTPVVTSRTLDEQVGGRVFLKCESFQRAGAFKFRGAYNTLARLGREARAAGALGYSSGNHAQAMAVAGSLLGIDTTIVMPEDAPAVKLAATRGYGAEVVTYDRSVMAREELGGQLAAERGLELVPPFDHPHVIAGQGTVARELLLETGPLDLLITPCGGGGLLTGCGLAARALAPGCRVVGVEPEAGDDATRSFHSGELERIDEPDTIADGARTSSLGALTFPLIRALASDMVTVGDADLLAAMRFAFERMKLVIEPTGALGLASLLTGTIECRGLRVGVVISGGNVDLRQFAAWLSG